MDSTLMWFIISILVFCSLFPAFLALRASYRETRKLQKEVEDQIKPE